MSREGLYVHREYVDGQVLESTNGLGNDLKEGIKGR